MRKPKRRKKRFLSIFSKISIGIKRVLQLILKLKSNNNKLPTNRAVIVCSVANLADYISRKTFLVFPDAEINTWRSGGLSINAGELNSFQMDSPVKNQDLLVLWDGIGRENIKKKFANPYFYLVEFKNINFLRQIMRIAQEDKIDTEFTFIRDNLSLLKYIKKQIVLK